MVRTGNRDGPQRRAHGVAWWPLLRSVPRIWPISHCAQRLGSVGMGGQVPHRRDGRQAALYGPHRDSQRKSPRRPPAVRACHRRLERVPGTTLGISGARVPRSRGGPRRGCWRGNLGFSGGFGCPGAGMALSGAKMGVMARRSGMSSSIFRRCPAGRIDRCCRLGGAGACHAPE